MRSTLIYAAAAATVAAALGTVAAGRAEARQLPPNNVVNQMNAEAGNDAHQAIARVYDPIKAKTDFYAKNVSNGVTTWDVDVKNTNGQSTAVVTTSGDYLLQGFPTPANDVPPAVQAAVQDLFKTPPQTVSRVKSFSYLIWLKAGKDNYELRLDATGKLLDVKPFRQRALANVKNLPDANANDTQTLRKSVTAEFPGAQPAEVKVLDPKANLYYVGFTQNGGQGWAEITGGNFIASYAVPIRDKAKIPAPVLKTLDEMFKSDQLLGVHQLVDQYYDVEHTLNGQTVDVNVEADGLVHNVRSGVGDAK